MPRLKIQSLVKYCCMKSTFDEWQFFCHRQKITACFWSFIFILVINVFFGRLSLLYAIYWMDSVKYQTLVVWIESNPFKHESGSVRVETPPTIRRKPHKETQAIERLYKDAPPSALTVNRNIDVVVIMVTKLLRHIRIMFYLTMLCNLNWTDLITTFDFKLFFSIWSYLTFKWVKNNV